MLINNTRLDFPPLCCLYEFSKRQMRCLLKESVALNFWVCSSCTYSETLNLQFPASKQHSSYVVLMREIVSLIVRRIAVVTVLQLPCVHPPLIRVVARGSIIDKKVHTCSLHPSVCSGEILFLVAVSLYSSQFVYYYHPCEVLELKWRQFARAQTK